MRFLLIWGLCILLVFITSGVAIVLNDYLIYRKLQKKLKKSLSLKSLRSDLTSMKRNMKKTMGNQKVR